MKKLLVLTLLVIVTYTLAACRNNSSTENNDKSSTQKEIQTSASSQNTQTETDEISTTEKKNNNDNQTKESTEPTQSEEKIQRKSEERNSYTIEAKNNNLTQQVSETVKSNENIQTKAERTESNSQTESKTETKKILVVYFSREGNTREASNTDTVSGASLPEGDAHKIATVIQENLGGDIFEIVTTDLYSTVYREVTDKAKKEQDSNYRPKLKAKVENMDSYDVIFLGYPNWWGTLPMPVFSFLEQYNFSGKTIIPFATHEGSALGGSVTDIKRLCSQSIILEGLAIRGGGVKNAKEDVSKWLRKLGMIK